MKSSCLAAAAMLALLLPGAADGGVVINPIAWGLSPGDTFRLVVITAGGTTATSSSIAAYDAFVNSQGLSGITYGGTSIGWQAIAQTPGSAPKTDASRWSSQANSIRTYNLNGALVSNTTNGSAFWWTSGYNQHLAGIDWTINGSGNLAQVGGSQLAWTGFDIDGTAAKATNYGIGGSPVGTVTAVLSQAVSYNTYNFGTRQLEPSTLYPYLGRAGAAANGWSAFDNLPLNGLYPLYAISDVITVAAVPEPSASALMAVVACSAGLIWERRRTRAARCGRRLQR